MNKLKKIIAYLICSLPFVFYVYTGYFLFSNLNEDIAYKMFFILGYAAPLICILLSGIVSLWDWAYKTVNSNE